MPLTVTSTKPLVGLPKNYGRRTETLYRKACESFIKDGGRYTRDNGTIAQDQCRIVLVQEYRGALTVFTTHVDQDWPPDRNTILSIPHRQLPQDFVVKANRDDMLDDRTVSESVPELFKSPNLRADKFVECKPVQATSTTAPVDKDQRFLTPAVDQQIISQSFASQPYPDNPFGASTQLFACADVELPSSILPETSALLPTDGEPIEEPLTIYPDLLSSSYHASGPHTPPQRGRSESISTSPLFSSPPSPLSSLPRDYHAEMHNAIRRRQSSCSRPMSRSATPSRSSRIEKNPRCLRLSRALK